MALYVGYLTVRARRNDIENCGILDNVPNEELEQKVIDIAKVIDTSNLINPTSKPAIVSKKNSNRSKKNHRQIPQSKTLRKHS